MPFGLTIRTRFDTCRNIYSRDWQDGFVGDHGLSASRHLSICKNVRFQTKFEAPSSENVYYLTSLTTTLSEGSQARSKATDSRSVLAGVPRFKSGLALEPRLGKDHGGGKATVVQTAIIAGATVEISMRGNLNPLQVRHSIFDFNKMEE